MDHSSPKGIPADTQRFFIPVEVDRTRVIAFDNRATFLLYQKYGAGFFWQLYERDPDNPTGAVRLRSPEAFTYFLWAGLRLDAEAAGERLTLEDVDAMILPSTFNDLFSALLVALSATQRAPRKAEPKNA